jgi:Protein of unknown function (DUF2867)
MNAQITSVRPGAGSPHLSLVGPVRPARVHEVPLPTTKLLARALPRVDWSDAFALRIPSGAAYHDPQEWADAIFHGPPAWIRVLFVVREAAVRVAGIEPGGRHVFGIVEWSPDEVLLGTDQGHLGFRASVLVEPGRVVLSTVVQLNNGRGRAYSALVRRIHPWVVRSMLGRAARTLAVAS